MWQKKIFVSAAILVLALLMVAFPAAGLLAGESSTATADLSTTKSSILEAYGKLPLLFIENQGQVDEAVRYYVTSSGQTVYFTKENIVFDLIRYDRAEANDTADRQAERLVFSLDFLGANSQPVIEGSGKDGAVVNYLIGNDPEQWHANVPTYRELVYKDIYPNIDLRLYGDGGMLRYDFVVNPGATPDAIALAYNGIDSLAIIDGELVMGTAFGDMVQSQPYIYQQIGDEVVEVEGGFRLGSDNTYGFHVAAYNNHYPLIIDPVLLSYSTYLGGAGTDYGYGIAVGTVGCAYVAGATYSADFPTTPGAFQVANAGYENAFVTKLSAAGNALVYSTYLGGKGYDRGQDIAVDTAGCAYVTGCTASNNFPTTPGAFQVALAGGANAFVTKLSAAGNALVYSTYLGSKGGEDEGYGIALDSSGCAYVTGCTDSADFPTTPGAFQVAYAGGEGDAFVTKLSAAGNALVYSTYLGGTADDWGYGIALDSANHAYVTGYTYSLNFPTTPGAFQVAYAGGIVNDAFVTKLSPAGNALVYSTYLGGTANDWGYGIALDSDNHAYVAGATYSADFPTTPGAFQLHNAGGWDAFVTKLSPAGNALLYSTYLGGTADDGGQDIAVDTAGCAYVAGGTKSADFPTTPGAFQLANAGGYDAFVTELFPIGNPLVYSTYLGGTSYDVGYGIALDSDNHAYVIGCTDSLNFPTTPGAFQVAYAGGADAFVTKIEENYSPYTPRDPSPRDGATGVSINADLSWTGGDPDAGDTVTYDMYCTTNPTEYANTEVHQVLTALVCYMVASANVNQNGLVGPANNIPAGANSTTESVWKYLMNPGLLQATYTITNGVITDASPITGSKWGGCSWNATSGMWVCPSSTPPLVSNNQSGTTYDPGALAYNTTYYWQIVATDNHGASTTGPLWDFTTQVPPGPTLAWNCPLGGQPLVAPNPGKGRPYLSLSADCAGITASAGAELWGIYYLVETGPQAGTWLWYVPGFITSTLTQLKSDKLYWVVVSAPCTLTIPQ